MKNTVTLSSPRMKNEPTDEKMIGKDAANPLRMLSAYLIVTATNRPPKACK